MKFRTGISPMKSLKIIFTVLIFLIYSIHSKAAESPNESALKQEAINIVKSFAGTLKPKLQEAIKTGGLEHAVKVCSIEAPKIAKTLSSETGWIVKRVSLKPRNQSQAAPDAFEKKVLHTFNSRQEKGEAVSLLEYSETIDNQFRYMKAQPVEGICLSCHGSSISTNVKKIITQHYPEDIATGYSLGQIRGAFSLKKDL